MATPAKKSPGRHPGGGRQMTKQADAESADINIMLRRWLRTGTTVLPNRRPTYGDFTEAVDLQTALMRVKQAETDFAALPSAVRKWCDNDPAKFITKLQDPDQVEAMKKLGLVEARIPADPSGPPAEPAAAPEEA